MFFRCYSVRHQKKLCSPNISVIESNFSKYVNVNVNMAKPKSSKHWTHSVYAMSQTMVLWHILVRMQCLCIFSFHICVCFIVFPLCISQWLNVVSFFLTNFLYRSSPIFHVMHVLRISISCSQFFSACC